jgi:hypothetical protein
MLVRLRQCWGPTRALYHPGKNLGALEELRDAGDGTSRCVRAGWFIMGNRKMVGRRGALTDWIMPKTRSVPSKSHCLAWYWAVMMAIGQPSVIRHAARSVWALCCRPPAVDLACLFGWRAHTTVWISAGRDCLMCSTGLARTTAAQFLHCPGISTVRSIIGMSHSTEAPRDFTRYHNTTVINLSVPPSPACVPRFS